MAVEAVFVLCGVWTEFLKDAAIECDDIGFVVLVYLVECKKHKQLRNISSKVLFNIHILPFKYYIS
jgi:hypothetical protein